MFENELQTRAAICGTGILLGIVFVLAHLPLLLLIVPVAVLFLGLVSDPEETHAVWYGMLNTFGVFDFSALTDAERVNYTQKKHYFWFGEVGMAAVLAGVFAVPVGIFLAGRDNHRIHRCRSYIPATLHLTAPTGAEGDEGRCGCHFEEFLEILLILKVRRPFGDRSVR